MKKSFVLFLVLVCLAVGGLAGMAVWVSRDNDSVEVTQTTLMGDPAAAQGLTITAHNQLSNHLFWDTRFSAQDAGQAQTQFQFYLREPEYSRNYAFAPEVMIPSYSGGTSSNLGFSLDELRDPLQSGLLTAPAADLAQTMGPNQTRSETVALADYYDCLPIGLQEYFYSYGSEEDVAQRRSRLESFQRFFNIPVPQELQVTYTVTTDETGGVVEVRADTSQWINLNTDAAQGEGGWYLILDSPAPSADDTGEFQLDLSHIRGGYGVYFLPAYTYRPAGSSVDREVMEPEQIQTVYVTPQGERTVDLYADKKGNLLLYTVAGETWYLNVLSSDGRQLRQRLELGELGSSTRLADALEGEDYLALVADEFQVLLLVWDGEGYTLRYQLAIPTSEKWAYLSRERLVQWDGHRLALLERHQEPFENYGYRLTVWQEGELTYQGEYALSFARDNLMLRTSSGLIMARNETAVELTG